MIRRVLLLLLVVMLTSVPLLGTACDDDETTLLLSNPMSSVDPNGIMSDKFKELVEQYTDVKVDVYHDASLYEATETFEALKNGAIDIAALNPAYVRAINPNLDVIGALRFIVANLSHGHEVIEDPKIQEFMVEQFENYNIRFLGYCDLYPVSGYASNAEIINYEDLDGLKMCTWAPGPAEPFEAMYGVDPVYFSFAEVGLAIQQGNVEMMGFPVTMLNDSGMYQAFKYFFVHTAFVPTALQMNLGSWNKLDSDTQDIINNRVIPELQDYMADVVIEQHKAALLSLNEKMDAIHVGTPEMQQEAWEKLQTYPANVEWENLIDPEIVELIEATRPIVPTWDQEVVNMLTYAGIAIP